MATARQVARAAAASLMAVWVCVGAGCFTPSEGFHGTDPASRIHAAGEAAEAGDQAAVPDLIDMLSSDDPAERMVAIATLDKLTGRRMGYEPTASAVSRNAAIARWRAWLAEGRPAPGPATVPPVRTGR